MENKGNRIVLVTGFGPFGLHSINASWAAVQELKNLNIEKDLSVTLITKEIPVIYEAAATLVPQLWAEHDPMLVVHVGVSSVAKCLTLETRAHKAGYVRLDVLQKCPAQSEQSPIEECPGFTETGIDVQRICQELNSLDHCNGNECKATVSCEAGRYLCEYTFHQSLSIQARRTIFIHIPTLDFYSAEKTAKGLYRVIQLVIEKLDRTG